MPITSTKLSQLKSKVDDVVSLHKSLRSHYHKLVGENEGMTSQIEIQKKRIAELEEKNKALTLAKSIIVSDQNSTDIKSTINNLIREVDKSLNLLNNN
jgi:hypothetical protein